MHRASRNVFTRLEHNRHKKPNSEKAPSDSANAPRCALMQGQGCLHRRVYIWTMKVLLSGEKTENLTLHCIDLFQPLNDATSDHSLLYFTWQSIFLTNASMTKLSSAQASQYFASGVISSSRVRKRGCRDCRNRWPLPQCTQPWPGKSCPGGNDVAKTGRMLAQELRPRGLLNRLLLDFSNGSSKGWCQHHKAKEALRQAAARNSAEVQGRNLDLLLHSSFAPGSS